MSNNSNKSNVQCDTVSDNIIALSIMLRYNTIPFMTNYLEDLQELYYCKTSQQTILNGVNRLREVVVNNSNEFKSTTLKEIMGCFDNLNNALSK